jgi:Asp-tRNA(Asn)/Glu-tRNA(Gln) amidotransferase A subunit family amidase
MLSAFEGSLEALRSQGAEILEVDDPIDFTRLLGDHRHVMAAEAAEVHSSWLDEFPHDYPRRITELIEEGRQVLALDYLNAQRQRYTTRDEIRQVIERARAHAVITPATIGTPPAPSTTGDPAFNSPWSFTTLPTVSFPMVRDSDGLPLALQFVGDSMHDQELLHTAEWCENSIKNSRP